MRALFRAKLTSWEKKLFRIAVAQNQEIILGRRQVYILPSRWGIMYGAILLAMLAGAVNYSLSLGYIITFWLAALANVAMLHTWKNLAYLSIKICPPVPVFAGDVMNIPLHVSDTQERARYAIFAKSNAERGLLAHLPKGSSAILEMPYQTQVRGYHSLPRIRLYTRFPMNLFAAWSWVDCHSKVLVYPRPSNTHIPWPADQISSSMGQVPTTAVGDEEFIGHKTYQIGDLPSHVDWKASSKGVGMLSKQWSMSGNPTLYLDWANTTGEIEERISLMARWIEDAAHQGLRYGLRVHTAIQIAPDTGFSHYHRCMEALATL